MVRLWAANTDLDWFDFLASQPDVDEVNFWQPSGHANFGAIGEGELFLFKLKSPRNDCQCAVTGFKFVNGGGRAEAEAAHIRSVEADGPDIITNGIALSGTVHWMFDRGLISLADNLEILLSRKINDIEGVRKIINADGVARLPRRAEWRPHPRYLRWHREQCFGG